MSLRKLIQFVLIVVVIGIGIGGVYLTYSAINSGAGQKNLAETAASPIRQSSDLSYVSNRWEDSVKNHEELVKNDRYNAWAWQRLGHSLWKQFQAYEREIVGLNSSDASRERLAQLQENSAAVEARIFEALAEAEKFAVTRNEARRLLAEILIQRGRFDEAIEKLGQAIDDGFCTRIGLDRDEISSRLRDHDSKRFREFRDLEKANYNATRYSREVLHSAGL